MAFTVSSGFTFPSGASVVTADRLNQQETGLTVNFDGTDQIIGRATAGAGPWESIPCTSFGRGMIAAASAAAAGAALGLNLGANLHATSKGLTLADAANVQEFIGQDASHGLVLQWTYNATAGTAFGFIGTFGQNNALKFQATNFSFDSASLVNAFQLTGPGRAIFGGAVDDGTNGLQTNTFRASGNGEVAGNFNVGGTFTIGGVQLGSMAGQGANNVAITGGAINGTPIGSTTPAPVKATKLLGGGGTPTIANGSQLGGVGAVTAIAGTDSSGQITITVGSGPGTSGSFADVTFATPFAVAPHVVAYPANGIATNISQYFYTTATTTGWSMNVGPFTISFTGAQWNYVVIG